MMRFRVALAKLRTSALLPREPGRCDGGVGGLLIISQLIRGPVVVNREHARASGLTPSGIGNFSAPQRRAGPTLATEGELNTQSLNKCFLDVIRKRVMFNSLRSANVSAPEIKVNYAEGVPAPGRSV